MEELTLARMFKFYERFSDVYDIVKPFFVGGGAHCDETVVGDGCRDRIYVYSKVNFNCSDCEIRDDRVLEYRWDGEVPSVFFEYPRKRGCVEIRVNGEWAGGYCPKYNVGSLTDWTHDLRCVQIARVLLPKLFQDLGLEEIKEKRMQREKVEITLGTDPEFEELNSWEEYIPVPTRYQGTSYSTEIGADGAGSQIELRPRPASSSMQIIKHIKQLIQRIEVPVSVKGDRYPLGAHIHIGVPEKFRDVGGIEVIVKALDVFLGKRLLDLSGRARGSYKVLGAYETKPWGFEYRSLPSAFLVNPRIARVVFKIASNVVKTLLERKRIKFNKVLNYSDYKRIAKLTKAEYELFERFIEEYRGYDGVAVNQNWVGKVVVEKFHVDINFGDDWSSGRRELVKAELLRHKRFFKKYGVNNIRIYGLKAERGKVIAGFNCTGYERIVHPIGSECENAFVFGFPYELRMSGVDEEIKRVVKAVVKEIRKRVRKEGE